MPVMEFWRHLAGAKADRANDGRPPAVLLLLLLLFYFFFVLLVGLRLDGTGKGDHRADAMDVSNVFAPNPATRARGVVGERVVAPPLDDERACVAGQGNNTAQPVERR